MDGNASARRWRALRLLFVLIPAACLPFGAARALAAAGVVHLKNGGWVEGDVMEVVPDQRVTIRLRDDTVREIAWDQVDHVEQRVAPPPPPPPPTAAPVQRAYPLPPPRWQPPNDSESWRNHDDYARRRHRAHRDAVVRLPTLAFLGQLTAGGSVDAEAQEDFDSESASRSLLPGFGVGAELSLPVSRFFALGVLFNYSRLKVEDAREAVGFLDGAFVPRVQFAFGSDALVLRTFVEVQIGIGWADLPNATSSAVTGVTPVFDIGPSAGFELFASDRVGFLLKFGWVYHVFGFDVHGGNVTESATLEYQTLVVRLGVMFTLGSVDK